MITRDLRFSPGSQAYISADFFRGGYFFRLTVGERGFPEHRLNQREEATIKMIRKPFRQALINPCIQTGGCNFSI